MRAELGTQKRRAGYVDLLPCSPIGLSSGLTHPKPR